jgi:hypothetical protein
MIAGERVKHAHAEEKGADHKKSDVKHGMAPREGRSIDWAGDGIRFERRIPIQYRNSEPNMKVRYRRAPRDIKSA